MKKSIFVYRFNIREKFFTLMALAFSITILYMSVDYQRIQQATQDSLEQEALNQALIVSKKLSYLADSITYSYMTHESELRDAMHLAQKFIKKYGRDSNLELLKKQINRNVKSLTFDVYIINKNFVIDNTTYKKDLGLDFHIIPEAMAVVKDIYEHDGSIDISTPSIDSVTQEYRSYILQRAEEGDFLVQLSLVSDLQTNMNIFIEQMQKEVPNLSKSSIYTVYPSSTSEYNVDFVWSKDYKAEANVTKKDHVHRKEIYEQFVENFDPLHQIDQKDMRNTLLNFVKEDHRASYIKRGDKYIYSVAINYNTFSFLKNKRANILILEFDKTDMQNKLDEQRVYFILTSLLLLALFVIIMYLIDKRLIQPVVQLHGLMREKKPVPLAKKRKYKDEIVSMSQSYNKLLIDINREISSNETLLEEFKTFTANSIHQVRTPVSVIKIALETIDAQNEEALNQIKSSLVSIEHLYDSVSYAIAQEHVDFTKEQLNLSAILKERVAFFEVVALANDKKMTYDGRSGLEVFMNKTELEFLIDNNLSNALKYSPPFTEIEISLNKGINELILTFKNKGKHIEDTKAIFERHFRGDKSRKGNGLGLHIVDTICKRNSILINVTSSGEINQFSYFFEDM